jgi:succinyl-CoA synthetase beta subunit
VKLVSSHDEIREFADKHIGSNLVTFQTDEKGQPVSKIFVEECADIDRELYLGAVIDRSTRRITFMASTEGGVEIEKVAIDTPEKILQAEIDPAVGACAYQGRDLAFQLGLEGKQVNQFASIFIALAKMFQECDLALLEINPLVVTSAGDIHCLDAKVSIDGNALFRQKKLAAMRDISQEDAREEQASQHGLNYVALEGNIGCMVNGAGLAMGTMDLVKLNGGQPANFLDVGGGANKEAVSEAFKIILSDAAVKAVLINIFGGIVQCNIIAEGIIGAIKDVGVSVPVIVRFEGNNAELGVKTLEESGVDIIAATGLNDAVQRAVKAAGEVA